MTAPSRTRVRRDDDGPITTLTLDGSERLNALGQTTLRDLSLAFSDIADDDGIRVVILRGSGRGFSGGADLDDTPPIPATWTGRRRAAGAWGRLLDDIEQLPQATVAGLHGWVVGGAVLLAAACDIRIAAADVRMRVPEVEMGLPLTWGGLPRLVREIGLPRTRDLVMTGRVYDVREAVASGFAQRQAPTEHFEAELTAVGRELAAMPAGPLAMTRAALSAIGRESSTHVAAWADPDLLSWAVQDPEANASFARYAERRAARSSNED